MNILFRILVVITLAVNIVCLMFAKKLEAKREWLLDGNTVLREEIERLAPQIESDAAFGEGEGKIDLEATVKDLEDKSGYVERDITEDLSASAADQDPQMNSFWDAYPYDLEKMPTENMSVDKELLKEVYILDPTTQEPKLDETNRPDTMGTALRSQMDALYKALVAQRKRLNTTREWLTKLREELLDTIVELNATKKECRQNAKTIVEREATISTLEGEKAELQSEVEDLNGQVADLEADKESLETDLQAKEDELAQALDEVSTLKKRIEEIVQEQMSGGSGSGPSLHAVKPGQITAGVKGKIVRVDNKYGYAIVKLNDGVYQELVGGDESKSLPDIPFFVKSANAPLGEKASYKATITLTGVSEKHNVVTCKIRKDFALEDVEVGDEIYLVD